jgi:hypothetical protein
MDQISDTSYRADSKRFGDEHLHDLFESFDTMLLKICSQHGK